MRVRDLLDVPGLGLSLLTGVSGLDQTIRHVYTTDLPDPSRYLTPGDLVLTGLIWCREPGDADRFVSALKRVTGPNADRWRCDLAGELAMPLAEGALVAPLGDEIVLLVPSPRTLPRQTPLTAPPQPRTCSRPRSAGRSRSWNPTAPGSGSPWGSARRPRA